MKRINIADEILESEIVSIGEFNDIAKRLSDITGKELNPNGLDIEVWNEQSNTSIGFNLSDWILGTRTATDYAEETWFVGRIFVSAIASGTQGGKVALGWADVNGAKSGIILNSLGSSIGAISETIDNAIFSSLLATSLLGTTDFFVTFTGHKVRIK